MGWVSLAEVFTPPPRPLSETAQEVVRERAAHRGLTELVHGITRGRLPGEQWRARGSCRDPEIAPLFFPSPEDDMSDPDFVYNGKREFGRPKRLDAAKAVCEACPVQGECLAWGLRIGGSDKFGVIGAMTWNQRKKLLAALRWEILERSEIGEDVSWADWRKVLTGVKREVLGKEAA